MYKYVYFVIKYRSFIYIIIFIIKYCSFIRIIIFTISS